jgi:tetratricopeptide (TPR) repeat protein
MLDSYAQLSTTDKAEIDSLKKVIATAKYDTTVINAYVDWDMIIYTSDPKLDLEITKKIEVICEDNLKKQLTLAEKNFFNNKLSYAYNSIGLVYSDFGNYSKAIKYAFKSLKIDEEDGNESGIASNYNNIGNIYSDQGDNDKAMDYYNKSIKIKEKLGNSQGISICLNNIGNIYSDQGNTDKALDYYFKCLKIDKENKDEEGIAITMQNIGSTYLDQGKNTKAMEYLENSLKLSREIGNKSTISGVLNDLSRVYKAKGNYKKAIILNIEALSLSQEVDAIFQIQESSQSLYENYKKIGQLDKALEMYEISTETTDSIESKENQKVLIRQEIKSSYEKQKALDDVAHEKEMAISAEQEKKQKIIIYAVGGGLGLVILFSISIFNRLQVTRKQKLVIEEKKKEVEHQKDIIQEAHKEITDSIAYAKRIQNAILPPSKVVKEYLMKSFILDCTGHGVPGAMVSVVCNNALNRSVREHELTDPGKILDKSREIVIQEFEKSDEEVKDGMDIALCSLEGNKLQYAGANNPLWVIRNGEILETKANKQPIGKFDNPNPYTTHKMELEPGDSIYIFSDGYIDQFGGEKGKKYKSKAFKDLLLSIQDKSMEIQKTFIDKTFKDWKGDLEQVDDVCVIGVKI